MENIPEVIERLVDKISRTFRIEQRVLSTEEKLVLVTESYIGPKIVYTHEMDLLPLLEEMKKRL